LVGLDCHIGSQLSSTAPMVAAVNHLTQLLDTLAESGIHLKHLDIGGGLGISYEKDEHPPSPQDYAASLMPQLEARDLTLIVEPGRVIAGNAGVLLMQVILEKENGQNRFVVVDAAMNDALRPALYDAWHAIEPVGSPKKPHPLKADVVGPICESGDFLGKARELPLLASGDLLVMRSAGAYGFTMASNYNSRPRAAEVLVHKDTFHVIRAREEVDTLWHGEEIPVLSE